jgi:hypothetical protein
MTLKMILMKKEATWSGPDSMAFRSSQQVKSGTKEAQLRYTLTLVLRYVALTILVDSSRGVGLEAAK